MLKKLTVMLLMIAVLIIGALAALLYQPDLSKEELTEYINAQSRFVELPMGANAHYRDQGNLSGPAIVLVHGGYGSLHNWEFWVPYLKDRYRVITMDLPAHGLTGAVSDDDYTRANMVRMVDQLVTALGVNRFTIGGHSMGGGVALAYALQFPEKVSSLILVGPEGIPPEGGYDLEGAFFESEADREGSLQDRSLSFSEALMTKIGAPWAAKTALKTVFADPEKVTDEMAQQYGRIVLHEGNRRAIALMFRQALASLDWEQDLVPWLGNISQPTLLMYGEKDTLVAPEVGVRAKQLLLNSELKIYPNVGHMIQMEATAETAADVNEFLAKHAEWLGEGTLGPGNRP